MSPPPERKSKVTARQVFKEVDAVIRACQAALRSGDAETMGDLIRYSRKQYAMALRRAGSMRFTQREANKMDSKSAQLEDLISKLVTKCKALLARDSSEDLVLLLLASLPFHILNRFL
jgi:hypothetical protein